MFVFEQITAKFSTRMTLICCFRDYLENKHKHYFRNFLRSWEPKYQRKVFISALSRSAYVM